MIDKLRNIYNLFKESNYEFYEDSIEFHFADEIKNTFESFSIPFESLQQNKIIKIYLSNLDFSIFPTETEFLKINIVESIKPTLILNFRGKPISYIEGNSYIDFILDESFYLFNNSIAYVDFINFLKRKDVETEDAFHFIDYFNKDLRKIVLTSLSEKGRIIIKYSNKTPLFDLSIDYRQHFEAFELCFVEDNFHLPKFLKNSLIEFSIRYSAEERMQFIFINLKQIINSAQLNFEVYLNNLSIDKIKKEYDDYKSKYFNELSNVLSKLTQKIIGLPIGVSATLFAISKIKDENGLLIILTFILIITLVYLNLLLRLNFKDLNYISTIFNNDYEVLENNEFFRKYPEELESFNNIKLRITDKISYLKLITKSYYWIFNISNIAIIAYILINLNLPKVLIIFISLVELMIIVITRKYILEKKAVHNKSYTK